MRTLSIKYTHFSLFTDLKIPMTAPVLKQIGICQGQNCKADVTEHFMMPFNLQANPPTPTETGVFIRRLPEFTVYVR
jgi:hypothetical protein